MSFWNFTDGIIYAELTSADPAKTMQILNQNGIHLSNIEWADPLIIRFSYARYNHEKVERMCSKQGDSLSVLQETGINYGFKKLFRRPVLTVSILFMFFMTLFIPTRIFFFAVEGNQSIPSRSILSAAEACGIKFGASRRYVRSEKMKNALLAAMPELKWAGINTTGCTATISVKEGKLQEDNPVTTGVSSIIAACDGYVTSCTVTRGNSLCIPGQIVKKGQKLISGYTDCGICIQATNAEGEVYGQTSRNSSVIAQSECMVRLAQQHSTKKISLILGKKRINLWKGSGISDVTCGRMYKEYNVILPGGFQLPVSLLLEKITYFDNASANVLSESIQEEMKQFAKTTVLTQTVAGEVLREKHFIKEGNGICQLDSQFLCYEMIGRVITEEIGETNGKTD